MTTDETIEQQARREAEAKYPTYIPGYNPTDDRVEAYAAALISERSKPQPSVEEIMDEVEDELSRNNLDDQMLFRKLRDRLTNLLKP